MESFMRIKSSKSFVIKSAPRELGHDEVLIKTTHSGICYTDVHAKEKGCGLGHEGVGTVVQFGAGVKDLKIGERVGWGCKVCVQGYRQYCADACGFAFGELDQGSMGNFAIKNRTFVNRIPDAIASEHAAPLMCAGASTYEALMAAEAQPSDRVGVVGIGGLGHMAVLFAKAMGCAVTAISDTPDKKEDAKEMGADEFILLEQEQQTKSLADKVVESSPIDVLLLCANEIPSLAGLIPLLARRARIVCMTIQQSPIEIPYMPFVLPGLRIIASTEASRQHFQNMLAFVARHGIKPWTCHFPLTRDGVAEAFRTLEEGRMRYRGVLHAE
ncbi:hypothetical protein IWZ00DRAFT_526211 [Phyllosticta capitalensis]|uniref:Enoyl reductase (ER) domain-containing protein n=1 Tax=Phyllosticta capitalensis TaxID=121624 RepID=A0ABR1YDI1_9PEZI